MRLLIYVWFLCNQVNNLVSSDVAEETQHAVCKIVTQEIQTSANASITRQLKGINTIKNFNFKLKQLEIKLLSELNIIKNLLKSQQKSTIIIEDYNEYQDVTTEKASALGFSRDFEIKTMNDTINEEKVYSYYWKVENVKNILRKRDLYVPSSEFKVLGHNLQLKLFPNYFDADAIGIQLNVKAHFLKQYRIVIMDQIDKTKDLVSQKFGKFTAFESIYRITNYVLRTNNYILKDSVIIKLMVFLDS